MSAAGRPGAADRTRGKGVFLLGGIVLVASGLGFPLTQALIARAGRRGAVVADGVAVGLLVRDAALVRSGLPGRLRPLPGALLRLELGAAALAAITGLAAVVRPARSLEASPSGAVEVLRRLGVGLLFGLHTYRFWIYLQPDRGLREPDGPGRGPEPSDRIGPAAD